MQEHQVSSITPTISLLTLSSSEGRIRLEKTLSEETLTQASKTSTSVTCNNKSISWS